MLKNLSIKVKLSILSVASLILLALSISYIAIEKSSEALLQDKFEQLSTIEVVKHAELNKYFKDLEELILTMASNKNKTELFKELKDGFNNLYLELPLQTDKIKDEIKLGIDSSYLRLVNYKVPNANKKQDIDSYLPNNINGLIAQYVFITDNKAPTGSKDSLVYDKRYDSSYMKAHKKAHNIYRKYLESFELYDIFLIDLEGNIVYTVFKENDFGTNLNTDIYEKSGLGRVYKKAMALGIGEKKVVFEDFLPYEPSYNYPASFIATPVYDKGKKVGVLAYQMSVDSLDSIMQFNGMFKRAGLGKTGEAYLVGSDYYMRTNSRFKDSLQNDIVQSLDTTIGVYKVKTKTTEAVIGGDGHIGKHIIKSYRGNDVLSIYHTLDVFGTTKWAIVGEIGVEEALKPANELKNYLLYMTMVLLIISVVVTTIILVRTIFRPLTSFQEDLVHFFEFLKTGKGDIKHIDIKANDEIGKISHLINESIVEVKHTLANKEDEHWVKEGVGKLNSIFIDNSTVNDVTSNCLLFMSNYLNSNVGVIYLYEKQSDELVQNSTFSYTNTQSTKLRYKLGEGVVGQVGLQKSHIILTDKIKEDTDMVIHTGTSVKKPTSTYTYPLIYQGQLYGVIELGSFEIFNNKKLSFLDITTKIIATAISTALKNQKVSELLDETEKSNEKLTLQQKRLEEANTAMEEQQHQLEVANTNLEEQQQQLEEANALMEEQQQQLELQNHDLQKAKEEVLKKADDLELSNKYKSEFMANMSHELRTPLNAIILLSQLLSKNKLQNLNEDDIKKAQTIYTSGNELLRLINDILDLSKVEAGKIDVIVDEFMPMELLENIKNLYTFSAQEKNISLNIIDNYNNQIKSDKNRISQILKNLISNALKFTDKGSISIEINKIEDNKKPIQIIVSDTGIGIPKKKQDLIFEAFTQADGSTSRKYGGTGLGLSITKELTHLLGGEITLESEENIGSKFIINLPNLDLNELKEIQEDKIVEVKVESSSDFEDDRNSIGNEQALLVIDDDKAFCEIVCENIRRSGFKALIANNASDGLELLQKYSVSGILLDLTLPDKDGVDVLKQIKADKKYQDIPVYIISSNDRDDKLIQMGAKGYGQKPLLEDDIEEIISALDKFINEHKNIKTQKVNESIILDNIDLDGISVLVVDDDIKNIFVLDNVLNESNAKVLTAYNGAEAIEQLRANSDIDIVLMDIMMPVMDGYEAITTIRADDELKHIPIIAVTAKAMKEDRDKCISLGADDFVSKPIDMDALVSLVKVWSDKKHK